MSARFDASGDGLTRTTNLQTLTAFTIAGWFYITTDRGAVAQSLLGYGASGGQLIIQWDDSINEFGFDSNNGTDNSNVSAAQPAVTTWFYAYIRCSGAGANLLSCGWAAATTKVFDASTGTIQSFTPTTLYIGTDPGTNWINGRCAGLKIWDAALTDAELMVERGRYYPGRLTNINSFVPMLDTTAANLGKELSVNARNFTVGGTLTVEANPPGVRRNNEWAYAA